MGGSGFIGSHLVKHLSDGNKDVTVFDVQKPNQNVEFQSGSILDASLGDKIKDIDADKIVNLAAIKKVSSQNYYEAFNINSLATVKLFEICRDLEMPLVHLSSTAIYGTFVYEPADENHPINPVSLYGLSKFLAEKIGREIIGDTNVPLTILRPTISYGPMGDDVVTLFVKKALSNETITLVDNGIYRRDFLFVSDLIHAINLAIDEEVPGIFNVGTGNGVTIFEMSKVIQKIIPNSKIVNVVGNGKEVHQGAIDITKIRNELNFEPRYSLEQGINETIKFYSGAGKPFLHL